MKDSIADIFYFSPKFFYPMTFVRTLLLSSLLLVFFSCGSNIMNQRFDPETYKEDYTEIFSSKELPPDAAFMINYLIGTHKKYTSEELVGLSYQELYELAKKYSAEGTNIVDQVDQANVPKEVTVDLLNEGSGYLRKGNSKKLVKQFIFQATFTNISDKAFILEGATFLLKGPFRDFITTAAYDVSCLLQPKETLTVPFILSGSTIRNNLICHRAYPNLNLGIDEVFATVEIELSGANIHYNTVNYDPCDFSSDGARLEAFRVYKCKEDFDLQQDLIKEGTQLQIKRGPGFYEVPEAEPIQYR